MAKVLIPIRIDADPLEQQSVWRRVLWRMLVGGLKGLGMLRPPRWLLIAIVGGAIYHVQGLPFLRVVYSYSGPADYPVYHSCEYWGYGRFVTRGPVCPLVVWKKQVAE